MTAYHVLQEKTFQERLLRALLDADAISEQAYWDLKYPDYEEMQKLHDEG